MDTSKLQISGRGIVNLVTCLPGVLLLAACGGQVQGQSQPPPQPNTADLEIGIVWDLPTNPADPQVECPRYTIVKVGGVWQQNVTPDLPASDSVQWQAYDPDGAGDYSERPQRYDVFFDPFQGQPIFGNAQGRSNPQNVQSGSPSAVYKYTVVAKINQNTNDPNCDPFDPMIRIAN